MAGTPPVGVYKKVCLERSTAPPPYAMLRLMSVYSNIQLSAFTDQVRERLDRLEAQMALVSAAAGVPYDLPTSSVPEDVVALTRAGDRLGAIRRYREITGCGMDEAKAAIDGI